MCSRSSSPALHKPGCTSPKDKSPRPQPRTGRFFCCNENRLTHASLLTQGVSQTAGTKGTSPSAKCIKSVPLDQSFKNVPNDYPCAKCYADVLAPTAKTRQSEQGALKRGGIDLLIMPPKLKGRLPLWRVCSVKRLRGLVKRRNSNSWLRSRCRRRWALRSSPNRSNRLSHRNRQS